MRRCAVRDRRDTNGCAAWWGDAATNNDEPSPSHVSWKPPRKLRVSRSAILQTRIETRLHFTGQTWRGPSTASNGLPMVPYLDLCEPIANLTQRRPDMNQQRSETRAWGRLRDMPMERPKHGTPTWSILFSASGLVVDGAHHRNMPSCAPARDLPSPSPCIGCGFDASGEGCTGTAPRSRARSRRAATHAVIALVGSCAMQRA